MKRSETSLLLAKVSAVDNRRLDPLDADLDDPTSTPILDAWHEIVGDLSLKDCLEALLNHRRKTPDWVSPAHIRAGVLEIRHRRHEHGPSLAELTADVDADDVQEWLRVLKERRKMVGDGIPLVAELGDRNRLGTVRVLESGPAGGAS